MMSKSKKQRSSTDIISSLPDSVICHILSFLPTKDIVATSIFSKRWNPLWLSVFSLDFTDQTIRMKTTTLCSHVYSVMLSRDNTLPIQSFRLRCSGFPYHEPNEINQLITAAIRRRTEILQLNMMFGKLDMKLASNIFTCWTLTVLKLNKLSIMDDIPQINNNISLIKTLHLHKVYFINHKQIIDFLLSFPILEELQTNNVGLHPCRESIISIPKTAEDKIKYFPNLVTAKLSHSKRIPLFLLSRARSLSIKLTWPYCFQVPIFYNLTQMELFSNLEHKSWPKKWMWMLEMLQHSPKLQHLIIHEEIENGNDNDDVDIWEDPKIVPECLSSQLKTCVFKNYRGKKCELQLAEYVMRNSKVLSNMTIHSACSKDLNAKYQMLQKLSVCPRDCELIFE